MCSLNYNDIILDDLETIRTLFSQLLKEDNMKHISYKTFNSIQAVGQNPMEDRYNFVQDKIGKLVSVCPLLCV